jgi:hypothetical protein
LDKILKNDSLKKVKLNKCYQRALLKVNEQRGKYTTEMQDIYAKLYQSNLQTDNISCIAHDKFSQDLSLLYNSIDLNLKNSFNSIDPREPSPMPLNIAKLILPAHKARSNGLDNTSRFISLNDGLELTPTEPTLLEDATPDLDKVPKGPGQDVTQPNDVQPTLQVPKKVKPATPDLDKVPKGPGQDVTQPNDVQPTLQVPKKVKPATPDLDKVPKGPGQDVTQPNDVQPTLQVPKKVKPATPDLDKVPKGPGQDVTQPNDVQPTLQVPKKVKPATPDLDKVPKGPGQDVTQPNDVQPTLQVPKKVKPATPDV